MIHPLARPTCVVLTGATSGIGLSLLHRLLADGHQVIALSRRATTLQPKPGLLPLDVDLADLTAVRETGRRIAAEHADATILINNAAVQHTAALTDDGFDPASMIAEAAINLVAPALLAHALIPSLRRAGDRGAVVNVSSGLGYFPKQSTGLYCATKAALGNFTWSLRYQLAADGVLVSEVVLPMVDTPMTSGRGRGKISADDAAAAILAGLAARRETILIGKARLVPLLMRIAPGVGRRILRGT